MNSMKTSAFYAIFLIIGFLPLKLDAAINQPGNSSPNVIIILADDLGWGDLGCYGNPIIKTPNLDRLAESGIKFTQFHSAGAICSPSRAALLAGKSPYRLGFFDLENEFIHLRKEELTIPELLKQKQYETFFAGKWHISSFEQGLTPDYQGFDYYFASEFNSTSDQNSTRNPSNLVRNGQKVENTEGYYCDLVVNEAVHWMNHVRNNNQSFFMEICFSEPHCPVTPPEEYAEKYESPEVDSLARTLGYGGLLRFNGNYIGYVKESNFSLKKYYYGMVEQMDAAVGTLMEHLESSGILDNTLIIFTSDNGPEYPGMGYGLNRVRNRCWGTSGPYRGVKRRIYEGGTRVPGIISWTDKIKPGQICETPVSSVDLLSTICKSAGVEVPHQADLDGVDITTLFQTPKTDVHRDVPLFWNTSYWGIPNMSMKYDDYTVVATFTLPSHPGTGPVVWAKEAKLHHFEVYDVQSDAKQQHDLFPGNEEKYHYLTDRMVSLWEKVQADGPEWPGLIYRKGPKTLRKTGYDVPNF
jgi:arylsulfatase A